MSQQHFTLEEVSAWLDGELELTPDQLAHKQACKECASAIDRQQRLRRIARQATPVVPTEQMWKAIDARIKGIEPGHSAAGVFARLRLALGTTRLPVAGLGAALAALLVIIVVQPTPGPVPIPETPAPTTEQTPPPGSPAPSTSPKPKAPSAPATKLRPAARKKAATKVATDEPARDAGSAMNRSDDRRQAGPPAAQPEPAGAAASAPAPEMSRKATASRAPAAAPAPAMMAAESAAPVRATWHGKSVVITADREQHPAPDRIVLTGYVLVLPVVSGGSYVATVNGLSQTLTGQTASSTAEIHLPDERIILKH